MTVLGEIVTIAALGVGGATVLANYVPATRIPWTPDEPAHGVMRPQRGPLERSVKGFSRAAPLFSRSKWWGPRRREQRVPSADPKRSSAAN